MSQLTEQQLKIINEFYSQPLQKVIYDKTTRKAIWSQALNKEYFSQLEIIGLKCPALKDQIEKSISTGRNIQSAVFSECVYAQTLANILNLPVFINCSKNPYFLSNKILELLHEYHLTPRYIYSSIDYTRMLIQAGGCKGIDCALISNNEKTTITALEFKEAGAKTSEPDLPKYEENGLLKITEEFLNEYPQFEKMLREKEDLNFFENIGNNINDFSTESIDEAVTNNYSGNKYADFILTEDKNGYLTMIPANEISLWATRKEGEIRPAGRNHYDIWTPEALKGFLTEKGAIINGEIVQINKDCLSERRERGGNGAISGYKINSLFFVYLTNCVQNDDKIVFNINDVRQLNPTIAGKMFFDDLDCYQVKKYYKNN